MNDLPSHQDFAACLGQTFAVSLEDGTSLALELIEADVLACGAPGNTPNNRTPFSLLFRGSAEMQLPQGTVPLEHGRLGRLQIFLVPIGPDTQGMRYEAVFN